MGIAQVIQAGVYENGLYLPNGNFHRENVCRGENYDQPMD
jgi:hypothetical protein